MLVSGGVLIWATGDGAAKGAAEGAAVLELAISAICMGTPHHSCCISSSGQCECALVVGWVGVVEGCGSVVGRVLCAEALEVNVGCFEIGRTEDNPRHVTHHPLGRWHTRM